MKGKRTFNCTTRHVRPTPDQQRHLLLLHWNPLPSARRMPWSKMAWGKGMDSHSPINFVGLHCSFAFFVRIYSGFRIYFLLIGLDWIGFDQSRSISSTICISCVYMCTYMYISMFRQTRTNKYNFTIVTEAIYLFLLFTWLFNRNVPKRNTRYWINCFDISSIASSDSFSNDIIFILIFILKQSQQVCVYCSKNENFIVVFHQLFSFDKVPYLIHLQQARFRLPRLCRFRTWKGLKSKMISWQR